MILPLVGVKWDDAHGNAQTVISAEDVSLTSFHGPLPVITYGILLQDDLKGVTVATEDYENGDFRGPTFIPRSLVKDMWIVSKTPSRHRRGKLARVAAPASPDPLLSGTVEALP